MALELVVVDHDVAEVIIAVGGGFVEREGHCVGGGRVVEVFGVNGLSFGVVGDGERSVDFHDRLKV